MTADKRDVLTATPVFDGVGFARRGSKVQMV
jgi:hypothetical protein